MSSAGSGAKTTMTSKTTRSLDLLRLVGGVALLSLGLVAVLPAANDRVWQLSVLVTEGGHWAMVACLPLCGSVVHLLHRLQMVAVRASCLVSVEECFRRLGSHRPRYQKVLDPPPLIDKHLMLAVEGLQAAVVCS